MDSTNRRGFAATYTEPSGRRWVVEEVARLETITPSIDGPSPRLLVRFTSEDSIHEQRFARCGPLRWRFPEVIEALFLAARPVRPVREPAPAPAPRRKRGTTPTRPPRRRGN